MGVWAEVDITLMELQPMNQLQRGFYLLIAQRQAGSDDDLEGKQTQQ